MKAATANLPKKEMAGKNRKEKKISPLKVGPVIYQPEDTLLEKDRMKKDMTLSELNHIFRLYLTKKGLRMKNISILGLFSVVFNDPQLARWHDLSKQEQSDVLTQLVRMPEVYDDLIEKIGSTAGDAQIIKSVVKDAYQNAIDSFSHAAYLQKKYSDRFPGFKIVLFLDQINQALILTLIDNGFGEKIIKPKKSHTGQEYGNDFISRATDWLIRRYVEKQEGPVEWDIAYTGGQGMALKKLRIELGMNVDLHFFATGAIFELKLKNFF